MAPTPRRDGKVISISQAVGAGGALAISCFISYVVITHILTRAYFLSRDNELIGGMWAVVATILVYRLSYQQSMNAALSRMAATLLSFILCLIYLLIFPFSAWGMAALIGIGAIALTLFGRSEDIIITGITTAVVMVVAGIFPQHAWMQPILRLVDTVVGIGVGMVAAWISLVISTPLRLPDHSRLHAVDAEDSGRHAATGQESLRKESRVEGIAVKTNRRPIVPLNHGGKL